MANWKEMIGKRVLVKTLPFQNIIESKVEEVSPSGDYVALSFDYKKHWYHKNSLILLEVLEK